ncbi:hypothetical protein SI65_02275 [Aspergillus cristatus]|uniref:General alpha-glucoside permease n=1 Tax=Aspergillus cristatus TaxID=573508 RepID=A0A1E3BKV3_ASPCR|nr:hypothetical protein SI65_02275 [Aspergillus cristatus]
MAVDETSSFVPEIEPNDEAAPLIDDESETADRDAPDQAPKSSWELFILTLTMGGLQVVWSIQHSSGSPYLLSLGMSKALLAFVWVAGPLTGTLVQPYIGIRSDNCRSRWGKRRPFMVLGGTVTVICLLALAWIREIVGTLLGIFGVDAQSDKVQLAAIVAAMILMYCLDFAINTIQAATRALIVDNAPWYQQETANAWASRVSGAGNILGCILGFMDLPKILPILGNTQFQVLCVLTSLSLSVTLLITCIYTQEQVYHEELQAGNTLTPISLVQLIHRSVNRLSSQTRRVFAIQFASWFGWFLFLFYPTTYIGQLYVNPIFDEHHDLPDDEIDKNWVDATRIGTFALFINAIVSFAASIILPLLIPSGKEDEANDPGPSWRIPFFKARVGTGLTLRRLWLLSHILFAACMLSTFFISTTGAASVMTGIIGIPWAITSWAPWAFIAAEIGQQDTEQSPESSRHDEESTEGGDTGIAGQAGIVLGLHNVFISLPQIVSSLFSSVVFKLLQKPRGEPWDESVAWVMRFGGCVALVAGYLTVALREQQAKV